MVTFGAQSAAPVNARTNNSARAATSPRDGVRDVKRASTNSESLSIISRAATHRAAMSPRVAATPVSSDVTDTRGRTSSRAAASATVARTGTGAFKSRAATTNATQSHVARSGVRGASSVRSATNMSAGLARAGTSRATAVFNDISKIGTGYAQCREAYATCMDQFCANANDTYRRCFCSSKFSQFRDTEAAIDQAKGLLIQFENNNLNAVDKTAAEVNAMYSASEGEAAIKNDTSGAAKMLAEIGDLLSGKVKAEPANTSNSLGVLDFGTMGDLDDIWAGGGSSIFDTGSSQNDLSALEGLDLYNRSNSQCLDVMADSCENDAVLNMARSSYNIMITQDCNLYEKKIDAQREAVMQTVRTAEKYLREARLEEYRAHNSADVNECISKVREAILADTACGPNYKRCLDYTGAYINQTTGDPIYSPRLFQLENLIGLEGVTTTGQDYQNDILSQNPAFDEFLESRRMYAQKALDSCRDISETVWLEFKRTALIEISQAQDEKIEEVKMSCVSTMKECYDTQRGALNSFDDTTAQVTGALSTYAAKAMCQDKVTACAALYGGNGATQCTFDSNGHVSDDTASTCGLKALLGFVDTVDDVRVAEGCGTAIESYLTELCTPTTGDEGYPWNCRKKKKGDADGNTADGKIASSVADNVRKFAVDRCADPTEDIPSYDALASNSPDTASAVRKAIQDFQEEMDYQLMEACEELDGYWVSQYDPAFAESADAPLLNGFYRSVYGGDDKTYTTGEYWGKCVENTTMMRCLAYNTSLGDGEEDTDGDAAEGRVATYDAAKDECTFTEAWYQQKCDSIGGYYENSICYVAEN